jgi:Bacteriophage holin family
MKLVIIKTLTFILWLLAPIQAALISSMALVALDFVLGVGVSRKNGLKITSNGFKRTAVKLLVYLSLIVLASIVERFMAPQMPLSHIASGFVGMTELKSCLENIQLLTGVGISDIIARLSPPSNKE